MITITDPIMMKGLRRPIRQVVRSERIPVIACMRRAAIKAHRRIMPKYVPLVSSPTNFRTNSGIIKGVNTLDLVVIENQWMLIDM